jgi:hypothetical protein
MPIIVNQLIDLLSTFIRFVGMTAFGLSFGWVTLDLLKKTLAWQGQIAIFLGLIGFVIAMAVFLPGALGGFAIGITVAIFVWGIPKKKKEDKEKE